MTKRQFIPDQLLYNENSWHNLELWKTTHYSSRDNAFIADIGGNGTGKTFLALRQCELLGIDEKGEQTLFNPDYLWEHVVFEKDDLVRIIDQLNHLPTFKARGYCVIVDEVQDALNSKEAMQEEVRAISSYLATLRSRRYIVHFTLPSWNMLVKDARRIMNFCNMMTRKPTTTSFSDLRIVRTDRFNDDPYLWRPRQVAKLQDEFSGMSFYKKNKWKPLTWNTPSVKTLRAYRKLKIEAQIKKGQKLKERMEHTMKDTDKEKEAKLEQLKAHVLSKFDTPEKLIRCIRTTRSGDSLSITKLAFALNLDRRANVMEQVVSILNERYPEVLNGVMY